MEGKQRSKSISPPSHLNGQKKYFGSEWEEEEKKNTRAADVSEGSASGYRQSSYVDPVFMARAAVAGR